MIDFISSVYTIFVQSASIVFEIQTRLLCAEMCLEGSDQDTCYRKVYHFNILFWGVIVVILHICHGSITFVQKVTAQGTPVYFLVLA